MNEMPPFTPRNVAKMVAKATVQLKVAAFTRNAIAEHTSLEATNTPVVLASGVFGWYVSEKTAPITDLAVDKTADFVTNQREKRQARKSAKKTETE